MIDHAPRIRAQQQAEKENAAIAALEKHSAPFQWALIGCVIVLLLSFLTGLVQGHFERFNSMSANNEALVQCLNGHLVNVDNVLVTCSMHTSELVADASKKVKVTLAESQP
jgi:hypothetical protein